MTNMLPPNCPTSVKHIHQKHILANAHRLSPKRFEEFGLMIPSSVAREEVRYPLWISQDENPGA